MSAPTAAVSSPPASGGFARRAFRGADRALDRVFGESANPLRQLGALGFHLFWIVVASGLYVYVLFDTSLDGAYASMEHLGPVGALMRSLHRYASDAFMAAVALHLAREWAYGRFKGFRWFSWVSGLPTVWLALAAGIGGYWLVWDRLALFIGIATTEWFAALPGFGPGMARNFLVAETLSDRLFSLLMFLHIGIPLILLAVMWVHIQRISQARTRPDAALGWGVLAMLVVLSLAHPAVSQPPADIARVPVSMGFDWFYLFAYPLIYSWSPAGLWVVAIGVTLLVGALPWLVRTVPAPVAQVNLDNCNGCGRCVTDCPYGAVIMQARTAGRPLQKHAVVLPELCASCGICAGACPSSTPFRSVDALHTGIDMPQLPIGTMRADLEAVLGKLSGSERVVAFGCDHGAQVGALASASVAAFSLPCTGQLPPSFVEYALRAGADGVLVTGCGSDCEFRFGAAWTEARLAGTREPHLRASVPRARLGIVWASQGDEVRLATALAGFRGTLARLQAVRAAVRPPRRREGTHG